MKEKIVQCQSCPWRVDCEPTKDIPNGYSVELHQNLRGTIAEPGSVCTLGKVNRAMACHYSKPGEEFACAGWLYNQLGVGNNIWARLEVMAGRLPVPEVIGKQHERFEDTLPQEDE